MRLPIHFLLFFLFSFSATIQAQQPLPVIHASSKTVSVRDGDVLKKGIWVISPEVRFDAYQVEKGKARKVTFYTDVDSISFDVHPGHSYDFVILLNHRDSAFTRISTQAAEPVTAQACTSCFPDTIPFHFGRGGKMFIEASVNGSPLLNLMFDTGADNLVLSSAGRKKVGSINFNDSSENLGFGGTTTIQRSTGNKLKVGKLQFNDAPLLALDKADGDGILGYTFFEKYVVQIDFDKKLIIIHDQLPSVPQAYRKTPLQFRNNLPFVQTELFNGSSTVKDWVEYDSGSAWSLFVNQDFATAHQLVGSLQKGAKRKSTGMGPHPIYSDLVHLPRLQLAGFALQNVPIDIERNSEDRALEWPILGMDVMKRFNVYIDYQHFDFYFLPNTLVDTDYNEPMSIKWLLLGIGGLLLILFIAYRFYKRMGIRSR